MLVVKEDLSSLVVDRAAAAAAYVQLYSATVVITGMVSMQFIRHFT